MLTIIGLIIIISIVSLLMTGKVNPIVALAVIPFIGALIAGIWLPGFTLPEISKYFENGLKKVSTVATMFAFAILFFSIMKDQHVFTPLIKGMVTLTRGNVIAVSVITTLIAGVVHLDGSGAATFLIIIPALLPLYKRLGMSPYLMLLLMCTSMGIMNMVPWGGPLGRAAAVTNVDAAHLWQQLIPVQLLGMVGAVVFAVFMGMRENRRIAAAKTLGTTPYAMDSNLPDDSFDDDKTEKAVLFWPNLILILITVSSLAFGLLSAPYTFMLALSIALILNYPNVKEQSKVIAKHAPQALNMAAIIMAAGAFLGIMTHGQMLDSIAKDLTALMPAHWISKFHILVGIMGVPLDIFTSTDAYYFALLPIVQQISATAGVEPTSVVYAMAIGNNAGTFVSPFAPAVWLAVGLAGVEMGKHLRYSFFWIWGFSFYTLGIGYFLGLY